VGDSKPLTEAEAKRLVEWWREEIGNSDVTIETDFAVDVADCLAGLLDAARAEIERLRRRRDEAAWTSDQVEAALRDFVNAANLLTEKRGLIQPFLALFVRHAEIIAALDGGE